MKESKISRVILTLNSAQLPAAPESHVADIDPRALVVVTVAFLTAMLSVPLSAPGMLIWFAAYPIILSPLAHTTFERVMLRSLPVLPFIVLIGVTNPIYDTVPALTIGSLSVSRGWVSLVSIVIRGLLSVQALLLVVYITGFNRVCEGLRGLHVPKVLVTQLLLAYRYMTVLLDEAMTMHRARLARGYGRRAYPPSMWGPFVGQLLLRSLERSRHLHRAMLARGFNGSLSIRPHHRWNVADTLYCLIWLGVFAAMRCVDLSALLQSLFHG